MSRFAVGAAQGFLTGVAGDAVGSPFWLIMIQVVAIALAVHVGEVPAQP